MDKKTILTKFLEDPLLKEKYNLSQEKLSQVNFRDDFGNDTVDVIKTAVFMCESQASSNSTDALVRMLNKYFDAK
jgi:hypothetical protein